MEPSMMFFPRKLGTMVQTPFTGVEQSVLLCIDCQVWVVGLVRFGPLP
jgi:hypothetical protein